MEPESEERTARLSEIVARVRIDDPVVCNDDAGSKQVIRFQEVDTGLRNFGLLLLHTWLNHSDVEMFYGRTGLREKAMFCYCYEEVNTVVAFGVFAQKCGINLQKDTLAKWDALKRNKVPSLEDVEKRQAYSEVKREEVLFFVRFANPLVYNSREKTRCLI